MRRGETQALLVSFNEAIDVASFQMTGAPAIRLRATGGVPVVATSISSFGGASIQGAADQPDRHWLVEFVSQGIGDYQLFVTTAVQDLFGNAMNQDGDRTNGEYLQDYYVGSFYLRPRHPGDPIDENLADGLIEGGILDPLDRGPGIEFESPLDGVVDHDSLVPLPAGLRGDRARAARARVCDRLGEPRGGPRRAPAGSLTGATEKRCIPRRDRRMLEAREWSTRPRVQSRPMPAVRRVDPPGAGAMRAPENSSERVLITGATSGLGEALALRFAREGARIAVTGRNPEKLARAAERVAAAGGEVLQIPLEVTRLEDFEKAATTLQVQWGGLDWLVNNAGMASGAPLEDWSFEAWQHVLDVNLWSVVYGCKVFAPLLRNGGGGHIVNVASAAAFVAAPEMGSYSASKAAVVSVSETLRAELAPQGIGVTVSCPGVFKTDLLNPEKLEAEEREERILQTLGAEMERATLTADQVAEHVIRSSRRGRLYSIPGLEMKSMWFLKRHFPEWSRKLMAYLFRKRLWRFSHLDDATGSPRSSHGP